MYSREIDGKNPTFASVGILYEDTFVLFDEETESLWYHLEGDIAMTAISGEYAGSRAAELPSALTTWNVWRELHPDTGYLDPASLPERSGNRRGRGGLGQGGQLPEGFEPPEGVQRGQRPDGFEPPEGFDRGQLPEGFEAPEGFQPGERPDGFEPSQGLQPGQPPEGAQPPDRERTTRRDRVDQGQD